MVVLSYNCSSCCISAPSIPAQIIIVASVEQLEKGSPLTKAARAAHAKVKGKVIFVIADRAGEAAEPIVEFFGLPRDSEELQVRHPALPFPRRPSWH